LVLLHRKNRELAKHLLTTWHSYPDPEINELARLLELALYGVYVSDHRSRIFFIAIGFILLVIVLSVII
jgi:hypothetical protein